VGDEEYGGDSDYDGDGAFEEEDEWPVIISKIADYLDSKIVLPAIVSRSSNLGQSRCQKTTNSTR
jgi:hypothetical protein